MPIVPDVARLKDGLAVLRTEFDRLRPLGDTEPARQAVADRLKYFQTDLERWRTVHAQFVDLWRRHQ